jgi:elongation factor Ts
MVAAYIHTGAKVGVLVEVGAGKDETTSQDAFKSLVKDITLQIAAANPTCVSRESVDPDLIAKEKEIAAEQFKDKPAQAVEQILKGKMEKFFQNICLVDQGFVKQNGDISIKEHVASASKELGDEISIRRFLRFQVGETDE